MGRLPEPPYLQGWQTPSESFENINNWLFEVHKVLESTMALNNEPVVVRIGQDEFHYQPDAEDGPRWVFFDGNNREYELPPTVMNRVLQAYAPNLLGGK